jgi:hypothetical protein
VTEVSPPRDVLAEGDDRNERLAEEDTTRWVTLYQPEKCFNGYTLMLFRRRVPILIDMNGRLVHAWPDVRAIGRYRLNEDGSLAVHGVDNYIKEYDWDGRLNWYFRAADENDFPHHDFTRLHNGNYLILMREEPGGFDYLLEVDRERRIVWEWRITDHLDKLPPYDPDSHDPTHANSIQELPPNPHFEKGDRRFRPGNILVSARNLECIFIIDRYSGKIVWQYEDGLDYQHEALMIPKGEVGAGQITLFNNGYNDYRRYRRSWVVAIDPQGGDWLWEFSTDGFFSSVAGTAQPLPNGSFLVGSSEGGRLFEVTLDKEIVWQVTPQFLPMRPVRYAADHCPQLEALGEQRPVAVEVTDLKPFIDRELYMYTLPEGHQQVSDLHGEARKLVWEDVSCQVLWLPENPVFILGYGLDPGPLGDAELTGRFRAFVEPLVGGERRVLLDDSVAWSADRLWRRTGEIRLPQLSYEKVRLCLEGTWQGAVSPKRGDRSIAWERPYVGGRGRPHLAPPLPIGEQERKLHEQQLKALGYVQ